MMPVSWSDIICRVMQVYHEWFKVCFLLLLVVDNVMLSHFNDYAPLQFSTQYIAWQRVLIPCRGTVDLYAVFSIVYYSHKKDRYSCKKCCHPTSPNKCNCWSTKSPSRRQTTDRHCWEPLPTRRLLSIVSEASFTNCRSRMSGLDYKRIFVFLLRIHLKCSSHSRVRVLFWSRFVYLI